MICYEKYLHSKVSPIIHSLDKSCSASIHPQNPGQSPPPALKYSPPPPPSASFVPPPINPPANNTFLSFTSDPTMSSPILLVIFTRLFRCFSSLISPLRGFLFTLIVFGTSIFGNYIVTLFLPLITVLHRHRQWRQLMDRAITFWMLIPLFFLHFIFRVKVRGTGDEIRLDQPAIIVMNHRTRLDWFYFWLLLWRINPWLMTTNKIALKQLLRQIPGAGFGMQGIMYIFLKRDLETDTARISRAVDYYADMGQPYQILMFPEGTDKTAHTTLRSDQYADREGLPRLRHVLYPRSAGFVHLARKMRERNYLACVYDVTVAYPGKLVQNEHELIIRGQLARHVHYDVRRIPAEELPETDERLHQWIIDLWMAKDQRLEQYYSERVPSKRRLEWTYGGQAATTRNCSYFVRDDWRQIAVKVFGFCFWISVVSIWLFHLTFLPFVQIGFAFLLFNYLYIYALYGGIDNLILSSWERLQNDRKKIKPALNNLTQII